MKMSYAYGKAGLRATPASFTTVFGERLGCLLVLSINPDRPTIGTLMITVDKLTHLNFCSVLGGLVT